MDDFSIKVLDWFDEHGRKHLPWQQDITPYRVWVSEIMLQQTQVATVIPYFERFMQSYPTVSELAAASTDDVLSHWGGLGYYARGRNLHKTAQEVVESYEGIFPCDAEHLEELPGIGPSTAAAIASIACEKAEVILDGNVKRVLARYHAVEGWPGKSSVLKLLWSKAKSHKPDSRYGDYSQAMMDLGATLCTRSKPSCERCPIADGCVAFRQGEPTAYPFPKPKKERPARTRQFILLHNADGEVMIQRRRTEGLWGGLWSFPEMEESDDIFRVVEEDFGFKVLSIDHWQAVQHAFSHYDLTILPRLIKVEPAFDRVMEMEEHQCLWYNTQQSLPGGVPAPVKQLLLQFQAHNSPD